MEWFTFKVGDEHFGIETRYIYRVVDDVKVIPVPLTPACHMGLIYYRGELFDVFHLGSLLKKEKVEEKEGRWTILMKWSGKRLALIPDKVIGLLGIEEPDRQQRVSSRENEAIRFIKPDYIWNKLLELSYGYQQIPKDLH